jgi:hypothetical protein
MTVNGDSAQRWKVVSNGAGGHLLINQKFNMALEADALNPSSRTLRLGEIDNSAGQLWKLEYE